MPDLPSGTVTFLFTDIESSARQWDAYPEQMGAALRRHDALMRQAIEGHGGVVFKTIGDAYCASFATASGALNAALAAQRAMNAEVWPEPVSIKVRMALHTGVAEARDNDYFGQPLNRVARLLSAGHGGQVLLSLPTEELTRDALPPSSSLKALGEHRLRDLNSPETVFQLLHPDLPSEFPPLKSVVYLPNNLPEQVTSFVGREKEIAALTTLLAHTRLLTLTGAGGCGKTRLALRVAAALLEAYPDGVWLVELAPLADPALVAPTVAEVLGVKEQSGHLIQLTLTESLRPRHLLLLLDNCEHLIVSCAQLTAALLRSCPNIKVMATSREALGIAGEQTYRVPSLSLPDPRQALTREVLWQYEATRLFIERAVQHKSDFAVTSRNTSAVSQLCHHLDGIPLAIELAAARVRSMSVENINDRLDHRFSLLTDGDRSALPHQQTLRATIDWSYDLLNARERMLLARLSVFAGGWTLAAAEQVGARESAEGEGKEEWEVLDLLASLVDKSLVIAEEQSGATRFLLLETVRQYAAERLHVSAEADRVKTRHQDWCVALAEEAEPQLTGPEQGQWLRRLETEHDNLRAALAWSLQSKDEGGRMKDEENVVPHPSSFILHPSAAAGLRLAGALLRFWEVRGHLNEGREHLGRALAQAGGQAGVAARAKALNGAGTLAYAQGDHAAARALLEESLLIRRKLGDRNGIALAVGSLGTVAHSQGDYAVARALFEEGLAVFREMGDRNGIAASLHNLGVLAHSRGDYARSWALFEESLVIRRELGGPGGVALALGNLGTVAHSRGDSVRARALFEESLLLRRELGDRSGIAWMLNNLGNVVLLQGDVEAARKLFEESLVIRRELGDRGGVALALSNLGGLAHSRGDDATARTLVAESLIIRRELGDRRELAGGLEGIASALLGQAAVQQAACLWGAAAALRESIGAPLSPGAKEKCDQQVAQARAALGEDVFAAAWTTGRAMTWEQAVAYALGEADNVE